MAITSGNETCRSRGCELDGPRRPEQWKDKKRYLWLIGLVVPSLAFIAFGMFQLTGWSVVALARARS